MYIAYTTYNREPEYRIFETERAAAEWLCGLLGNDDPDFWVTDDGKLGDMGRSIDYSMDVFKSLSEAAADIDCMAGEDIPGALYRLADAVERWNRETAVRESEAA